MRLFISLVLVAIVSVATLAFSVPATLAAGSLATGWLVGVVSLVAACALVATIAGFVEIFRD